MRGGNFCLINFTLNIVNRSSPSPNPLPNIPPPPPLPPRSSQPSLLAKSLEGVVTGASRNVGSVIAGVAGAACLTLYQKWNAEAEKVLKDEGVDVDDSKEGSVILVCHSTPESFTKLCDDINGPQAVAKKVSSVMKADVTIKIGKIVDGFSYLGRSYLEQEACRRGFTPGGLTEDLIKMLEAGQVGKSVETSKRGREALATGQQFHDNEAVVVAFEDYEGEEAQNKDDFQSQLKKVHVELADLEQHERAKPIYLQEPDSEEAPAKEVKSDLDRYICRFDVRNGLPLLYPEFLVLLGDFVLKQEYETNGVSQVDRLADYNCGSIPWSQSSTIGSSRVFLSRVPSVVKKKFNEEGFKWKFAFLSALSSRWLISLYVLECFVEDCAEEVDGAQTLPDDWAWVNEVKIHNGPQRFSATLIASGSHVFAKLKLKPVSIDPQGDFQDESRLSRKFPEDLLHVKLLQMVPHCSSRLSNASFAIGEAAVQQYTSDEMASELACWIQSIFDNADSNSHDWGNAAKLCRQFGAESLFAHANPRNPNHGFKNMILNGLSLCGKVYLPVAVSSGQGSSYRMTMASFQQSTETPLKFSFSQSTWNEISKSVASLQKGLVRMSLLKTPSVPCGNYLRIGSMSDCWSNHAENGATMPFSDGCGIISSESLKRCWVQYCQKMSLHTRTFMMGFGVEQLNHISPDDVPCAIQIRIAGVKGMLVVCDDYELMKGYDILIRKDSMIKFFPPDSFPEHRSLEIVNFSCASKEITLNIELMTVLVKAGVKLGFLQSVCEKYWKNLFSSQEEIRLAQLKNGDLAGFNMSMLAETQGSSNLGLFMSICVPLRFKLPDSGLFFGVADFTGTLKPGEVFLKPSKGTINSNNLLIMKDPCLKERDIMRVRICKYPDHRIASLRDVVVFACPKHVEIGSRDVPDPFRVAGSDLDGDQFLCIWNADVQQQCKTNERLSETEDLFRQAKQEKKFTDEVQLADLWKEGIYNGEQLREVHKKQNGLQPWDECPDAKHFQDQRDRQMRDKIVAAGKNILSPLLGEVGYVPFNELRVIRQNYLCNWLEGGAQDGTLFESAEELGKCATDAVDAVKSGKWLKAAGLTEKARDAILKEPSGFIFDWSICRHVNFNQRGFLTQLICYGAKLLKIDVGSLSQPGLSFADEMHLQSAVCRILSLKNRKNEHDMMLFPVLPPDIHQQDKLSIFRRMAQFSLFWKVLIARRSFDEHERVRMIVSSCPVQSLPIEDLELLVRQRGNVFLTRSGYGKEKVLDGCTSGLLKYYDIVGEQFRDGLVKEFLNGFGIRSFEFRPLLDVPDSMEYSAIHPTCDNYVKLSRIPEMFFVLK